MIFDAKEIETTQSMDSFFGYKEIQALQNLISPPKDDSDSEELYQNEVKRKGEILFL